MKANFQLIGTKEDKAIYLRLSVESGVFRANTGYKIHPTQWNAKKKAPKQTGQPNQKELKQLTKQLTALSKRVVEAAKAVEAEQINIAWLKATITGLDAAPKQDKNLLSYWFDKYTTNLANADKSHRTIKKYERARDLIRAFEVEKGTQYRVKDVDFFWRDDYTQYLKDNNYSNVYINRNLMFAKTVCISAFAYGVEVNEALRFGKFSTLKNEDNNNVYLSYAEIAKIQALDLEKTNLSISRDWLVVGCFTGQRVSDLLSFKKSDIVNINGVEYIGIKQEKTSKTVHIPILDEVQNILNSNGGEFPPKINIIKFNKDIKQIGIKSKIVEAVEGSVMGKVGEVHRKIKGTYKKYELLSSHTCRRSFATNFYNYGYKGQKFPLSLIKSITGHSTEKMFLLYIKATDEDKIGLIGEAFKDLISSPTASPVEAPKAEKPKKPKTPRAKNSRTYGNKNNVKR